MNRPCTAFRCQKDYDAPAPPGGRFDVTVVLTQEWSAETRPTLVSDRPARVAARLRAGRARLRDLRRTGGRHRGRCAADPVRLHACLETSRLRSAQRADFRFVTLPAAPHQLTDHRGWRGRDRDYKQVCTAHQRKAHSQSHELRDRGDDAADRSRVGLARAVGQRGIFCLPDGVSRRARRKPRRAKRRHLCVHRVVSRARLRAVALARRAADDSGASPRKRCTPALHVLHDLRSAHDAGLTRRTDCVRFPRRHRRLVRAIRVVPDERAVLVAGSLRDDGSIDRSTPAGRALCVGTARNGRDGSRIHWLRKGCI